MSPFITIKHIVTESNHIPITNYLLDHLNVRIKITTNQTITKNGE